MPIIKKQPTVKQKRMLEKAAQLVTNGPVAITKHLFEIEERLDAEIPQIKNLLDQVRGEPGENGYTPIKGHDYYTEKERQELIREIYSRVFALKPKDGYTPVAGTDYPSKEQVTKYVNEQISKFPKPENIDYDRIIFEIIKLIPEPKPGEPGRDGSSDTAEDVRKKLESLSPDERLDIQYIKGTDEFMEVAKVVKNGAFNPTMGPSFADLKNLQNQITTLQSSSSGSGNTYWDPTEIPDGNKTVFTYALATAQPTFIISGGAWMKATSKSGTQNWSWNAGTLQATFTIPPTDDAIAVK